MPIPVLETERLILRAYTPDDAPRLAELAGAKEIYQTTISIPHPYSVEQAHEFIGKVEGWFDEGTTYLWAIALKTGELIGGINIYPDHGDKKAELGYWIGVPYWGCGYGTEAAREAMRYAFEVMDFHRIYAQYFAWNTASGRIMEKLGMQREAYFREDTLKDGKFHDSIMYAILRSEWEKRGL